MKMVDPYAEISTTSLQNGLTIYYLRWPVNFQQVSLIIHTGGEHDPPEKPGVAHFLEHVIAQNHPNMTDVEIQEWFEKYGNQPNLGLTSWMATLYGFKLPFHDPSILLHGLNIFGQLLLNASITNGIEVERNAISNELTKYFPYKERLECIQKMVRTLYAGTHREHHPSLLGTMESIQEIQAVDLQAYYNEYYVPQNMSLVSIGGMEADMFHTIVSQSLLSTEKPGQKAIHTMIEPKKPASSGETLHYLDFRKPDPLTYDFMRTYILSASTSHTIVDVICWMLYKLLHKELRAKNGDLYEVRVEICIHCSHIEFTIQIDDLPKSLFDNIEKILEEKFEHVFTDENLFQQVQKMLLNTLLYSDISANILIRGCIYDLIRTGKITTLQKDYADMSRLTFADIVAYKKLFHREMSYTLLEIP